MSSRKVWVALLVLGGVLATAGCTGDASERLTCDNLLPVEQASYAAVAALVTSDSGKGCSGCHNTKEPVYGLNFEGPGVAYDALTTKMSIIYPQLVSGRMPENGVAWTDADLQLLRTWYCNGALFQP